MIECRLALARLNFVAAQVLLGLGVGGVLFCNWIVFLQRQFALTLGRTILRIYRRVIRSVIAQIAHQTDQLAFRILLCHNSLLDIIYSSLVIIARLGRKC